MLILQKMLEKYARFKISRPQFSMRDGIEKPRKRFMYLGYIAFIFYDKWPLLRKLKICSRNSSL